MTSEDELYCVLHDEPSVDCVHIKHGELHSCGYVEDTFACKIRHIHINTGDAKAGSKAGSRKINRWDRARELHENHFNQGI